MTTTALTVDVSDDEAEASELSRILECRKLLLEAGCDPEFPIIHRDGTEAYGNDASDWLVMGVLVCVALGLKRKV